MRAPTPGDTPGTSTALVLPVAEVVAAAADAGFAGEALVTAVAIAYAESGLDAHAVGDVDLTQRGEVSVGLWQINYRPTRDKTDAIRDPHANLDPKNNAGAAYALSGGGRNFKPWSTFNNGAYKKYLAQARDAVSGNTRASSSDPTADAGPPSTPILTGYTDPVGTALPIRIGGALAYGELGAAVIGGSIDLSTSEVSEMQVQIEDPDLMLSTRYRLNIHSPVDNYGIHWQVVELHVEQGSANPHVTLICHPAGAVKLRTGAASSARKITRAQFMQSLAKAAGLRFVGEPGPVQDTIAPATVKESKAGLTVERPETAWEMGVRLAAEEGKLFFESAGTLYFATPKYLIAQGRRVQFAYKGFSYGSGAGKVIDVLRFPDCQATTRKYKKAGTVEQGTTLDANGQTHSITYLGTMDALDDVTVTVEVERALGEGIRPAMTGAVAGVGPFNSTGLMVTRVAWDLDTLISPVKITLGTVEAPVPTADTSTEDTGAPLGKTKSALDFVTVCLRQVGDAYVYGAETSPTDADPDAFDCSELVQWGCAQVGVTIPDGSSAQKAACTPISVAQAAKTRGALLFHPGHVAISLGDGKNTVEAKGRKYGVVSGSIEGVIGNRFTSGGLIPGMAYS